MSESVPAAASACRQLQASAMGGSASAAASPPSVRPVCLTPIAMPRSRGGNHSTTALPVAGLRVLNPKPPRTSSVQREEPDEVRAQGRERDHGADEELTQPEGEANTEAVGQPAGGERPPRAAQE